MLMLMNFLLTSSGRRSRRDHYQHGCDGYQRFEASFDDCGQAAQASQWKVSLAEQPTQMGISY